MATANTTPRVLWAPFTVGTLLLSAATGLLLEDAILSGHWTATHLLMPILTIGTTAAAVQFHKSLASWRVFSATAFLALAVLGSLAVLSGTIGRQADTRETKTNEATRLNRALAAKQADLEHAKAEQKKECRVIGKRCQAWNDRVDDLTREASAMPAATVDPKAEAVARLATLLGYDGNHARAIVAAFDPLMLPAFLELGAVLFFGVAFPHRKVAAVVPASPVSVNASVALTEPTGQDLKITDQPQRLWTRDEILADLRDMKNVGAQRFLAKRYGVSEAHVSRLMKEFAAAGLIARPRDGQRRQVAMLPAPRQLAKPSVS